MAMSSRVAHTDCRSWHHPVWDALVGDAVGLKGISMLLTGIINNNGKHRRGLTFSHVLEQAPSLVAMNVHGFMGRALS
jgi:hypothetical protein